MADLLASLVAAAPAVATTTTTPAPAKRGAVSPEKQAAILAKYRQAEKPLVSLMDAAARAKRVLSDEIATVLDMKGLRGRDRSRERAALIRDRKAALMRTVDLTRLAAGVNSRGKVTLDAGLTHGTRGEESVGCMVHDSTVRETVTVPVEALVRMVEALRAAKS